MNAAMSADQAQQPLPLPWLLGLMLLVPTALAVGALWRAAQRAAARRVDRAIDEALALTRWDDTPARPVDELAPRRATRTPTSQLRKDHQP